MQTLVRPGSDGHDRRDPLSLLLSPHTQSEFLARYFEKEPLHVARNIEEYFAAAYDIGEVESSLVVGGLEHDKFAVVKSGTTQIQTEQLTIERRAPRARHTGRQPRLVLDPRAVLSFFDRGYTLVIKDASAFSPRLQKFVNRLQQQMGFYTQTNVYFTPPKAQGFDVHYDTHDTMVMQIEGTKVWRVYEPVVVLPVETQPFSKEEHGKNLRLRMEVKLDPGDTLYVPHGFPHEGAANEERSLHVTLAMCPMRVIDLLEAMLDLAAVTDVELRRSLPPGWHESPAFAEQFSTLVRARLAKDLGPNLVTPATEMVLRDLFAVTRAEVGGGFDEWERFAKLHASSRFSLCDDTPYVLRRTPKTIELLVAGKSLGFPAEYGALFARLERGPMTVADVDAVLPGNVGRALVKMLLLEGLISVA